MTSAQTSLDWFIRVAVEAAPPLTDEQVQRLRPLLAEQPQPMASVVRLPSAASTPVRRAA